MLCARLKLTQALRAGQICHRVGTRLAASGAAADRRRTVSGGVVGRALAGAAVVRPRHRARACSRGSRWPRCVPLIRFRWPSRDEALSRLDRGSGIRHRPATALTDTLTLAGPGRAGAVAGAARAHAGLAQAHPRRAAVAAARHPRSLGAARAGHGDAGRGLLRRRRRARDAGRRGIRLERRAGADQCPRRCLDQPAALYRQAAGHPVGRQQGGRSAAGLRPARGAGRLDADRALLRRQPRCGRRRRPQARSRRPRQAPKGTNEKHFTIAGDGTAHVRAPSGQPQWAFTATPDRPPTIALAKDPERQARGSLQLAYKIEDDYGVTEAQRAIRARRQGGQGRDGRPRGRCSSRRNFRWCCRMRAPATASARP